MVLKDEDPTSNTYPTRDVVVRHSRHRFRGVNRPTTQKQLDHMKILVGDAMPGDSLFLHCKSSPALLNFRDSINIQSLDMADKYPTWMGTKQTV